MVKLSEDNTINKNEEQKNSNQKPLYTQEQRDSFVRGFIDAWRSHKVYVDATRFRVRPMHEILAQPSKPRQVITVGNVESAIDLRSLIEIKIKIASGSTDSTPEGVYQAINSLYNDIVDMQGRHYLAGTFPSNEAEDRIFDKVMKRVDSHIAEIRRDLGLEE